MFKAVQRQLSWGHHCFNTTVIARPLRDSIDDITATRLSTRHLWNRKLSTHLREMVKARKYVVVNHFVNEAKPTDLKLVEEELPPLQNGEYLAEAEYLSVDPYMRPYLQKFPVGITMIGSQVAKIVESKNPDFPVGKRIVGNLGWRTHTIVKPNTVDAAFESTPYILPDLGNLPPSLGLGMLGMPGNTAYFGLLELCKPKPGETIVVSGAAGAVGSHVGQIAKNLGLTVIGICGSDEKCKWLTEEMGFDTAINYKTMPIASSLRKAAPRGVDCYFDNVGGEVSNTVMYQMRPFSRVAVCGCISNYDADPSALPKCTVLQPAIIFNQMKIEGFVVTRWSDRWLEGITQNLQWIREGKLRYRETVTKGFENMFDAFIGMMRGENIGKAIVKV
ncbi:PREDICTED: prostaglandin reductase 1-like isoform X1 [Vollenhovia emeryi]|uniref:prostaglandin reductase 1-like isoform X1 n=1 Tax=Vollenhovia emeryi TaxID=411798 RepID=UPI0005F49F20|nr:PREDICTED: prostaglandin reductase 1-like isoform X1 [Vollenhovia emeryi]